MSDWQIIINHISAATGETFAPTLPQGMAGGCINTASRLSDGNITWFVKSNSRNQLPMFEAEAEGLTALADTHSIRVPQSLCTGVTDKQSYIVMEYVALTSSLGAQQAAGRQLAQLHRSTAKHFGWHRENTIGATPQKNIPTLDWVDFWAEYRLGFQLQLAADNGYGGRLQSSGDKLLNSFAALLDHAPEASLIHGDLWGGNLAFDENQNPVIYDPATYYADREAELAMTELFGGFSPDFYAAYNEAWSLDMGYAARKKLYNLYHVLNHLNLFGTGYLGQAQQLIDQLLAELGVNSGCR